MSLISLLIFNFYSLKFSHIHIVCFDHIHPPLSPSKLPFVNPALTPNFSCFSNVINNPQYQLILPISMWEFMEPSTWATQPEKIPKIVTYPHVGAIACLSYAAEGKWDFGDPCLLPMCMLEFWLACSCTVNYSYFDLMYSIAMSYPEVSSSPIYWLLNSFFLFYCDVP